MIEKENNEEVIVYVGSNRNKYIYIASYNHIIFEGYYTELEKQQRRDLGIAKIKTPGHKPYLATYSRNCGPSAVLGHWKDQACTWALIEYECEKSGINLRVEFLQKCCMLTVPLSEKEPRIRPYLVSEPSRDEIQRLYDEKEEQYAYFITNEGRFAEYSRE